MVDCNLFAAAVFLPFNDSRVNVAAVVVLPFSFFVPIFFPAASNFRMLELEPACIVPTMKSDIKIMI